MAAASRPRALPSLPFAPSRRSVLKGAAASGALTAVAATPRAQAASNLPVTEETHRVVIIGSGFGGGVAALRLAQAGVDNVVLERGRWWPTGPNAETFPHIGKPDKRMLWYGGAPTLFGKNLSVDPYVGLMESVSSPGMMAMCPTGVGGGSLVYQGMTLKPSKEIFEAIMPSALDYDEMERVYYPRVAQMLQIETAPDELIASKNYGPSRAFKQRAEAAGCTVEKIPMPIDWNYALAELRGEMKPSYTNGDCGMGVNNGGKHSVDVTYLAQAQATGHTQVRAQHHVTQVSRAADGRWVVDVDRISETGEVLQRLRLTSDALFLAAGSVNTSRILVRAKAKNTIPNLPSGVGEGWGTNGDRIYMWSNAALKFGVEQGGPVVYGTKDWNAAKPMEANTIIQASLPSIGFDALATMMVGFGVSPDRGRWVYNKVLDKVELKWPLTGDWDCYRRIDARVRRIAGSGGMLVDTNLLMNSTWHSLGGANMGVVCDDAGRVKGQKGLYVVDGALIPGGTGACNPSMTIAAVAERALDRIVKSDVGSVI